MSLSHHARRLYARAWNAVHEPESVLNREWDNLLILDACRFDVAREMVTDIVGEERVESRVSVGSSTPEFLERTFGQQAHHDVVYVTANPQPIRFAAEADHEPFHALLSVLDAWDETAQTVPPKPVVDAAKAAGQQYPRKRLVVHFLQPHTPFIGQTAAAIRQRLGGTIGGLDPGRDYTQMEPQEIDSTDYDDAIGAGIRPAEIRRAYRETFAIAFLAAEQLGESLDGRTVVTADHGERLGERRFGVGELTWSHPSGAVGSALRQVPWIVLNDGPRRPTEAEPPAEQSEPAGGVERQLRALGYA